MHCLECHLKFLGFLQKHYATFINKNIGKIEKRSYKKNEHIFARSEDQLSISFKIHFKVVKSILKRFHLHFINWKHEVLLI